MTAEINEDVRQGCLPSLFHLTFI